MTLHEIFLLGGKTIICYFFLIIILKIMGKREMSQVSTFDIVVFLIISELFTLSLNEPKLSIFRSIIPIVIIVILQLLTSFISLKCRKIRLIIEGRPTYLIKNGEIDIEELKKQRFNLDDLMSQLHISNIQSPKEVSYAFIEDNGKLCVITKKDQIIKNPELMILDGKINEDYLRLTNMSKEDVISLIKKEGYSNVEDIFLAQELIDELYIVPFKKGNNKK